MAEANKSLSFVHKVNKTEEHTDYQRIVAATGEEVEYLGYYKSDSMMIAVPPDHTNTIDKLLEILRGTGISKITIAFLNKNMGEEKN